MKIKIWREKYMERDRDRESFVAFVKHHPRGTHHNAFPLHWAGVLCDLLQKRQKERETAWDQSFS